MATISPSVMPVSRYLELDALRGLAVMGILLMNIISFAMPEAAYISPMAFGGTGAADIAAWAVSYVFIDGKMRGLFTLLFGASMMLVIDRAALDGQNPAAVHYWRMFWLALFGLAHFFLLWFGDILFLYAAIGCLAFFMHDWSADILIRRGILLFSAGFALFAAAMGGALWLQYAAGQPGASAEISTDFQAALADFITNPSLLASEVALYQSGYWPILQDKLVNGWSDPFAVVAYSFLETLPLMMIGMGLYKNGFITGAMPPKNYMRVGIWLTALGGVVLTAICAVLITSNFDPILTFNAVFAWSIPSQLLMTIGYAALFIAAVKRWQSALWMHRIAAVGRTAFSNYLGTSLVMTFIFYGWGLGLFGTVDRAELYLFVIPAWAAMLMWSRPWLKRFHYGPLEWLWRSLSRRKLQALRRKKPVV